MLCIIRGIIDIRTDNISEGGVWFFPVPLRIGSSELSLDRKTSEGLILLYVRVTNRWSTDGQLTLRIGVQSTGWQRVCPLQFEL